MEVKVVGYFTSVSPLVRAFVDVELDGWLRFNGINFLRDGTLKPAQLTPVRDGRRMFRDTVQVLDADLAALLADDILTAIARHLETIPPEKHSKPPRIPEPKPVPVPVAAANVKKVPAAVNGKKPLPPPARLTLAGNGNRRIR
jgi:hypothetical protein